MEKGDAQTCLALRLSMNCLTASVPCWGMQDESGVVVLCPQKVARSGEESSLCRMQLWWDDSTTLCPAGESGKNTQAIIFNEKGEDEK